MFRLSRGYVPRIPSARAFCKFLQFLARTRADHSRRLCGMLVLHAPQANAAGHRLEVLLDFAMLAVIVLAGLFGPLLAYPQGWHVPEVVGELLVGVILGSTGLGYLDASDPTFSFLAEVGFGLVMFVVGTHVPIRDHNLQGGLGRAIARAVLVGAGSAVLGVVIASAFGTGHAALYARADGFVLGRADPAHHRVAGPAG